jgi:hypothetical protein
MRPSSTLLQRRTSRHGKQARGNAWTLDDASGRRLALPAFSNRSAGNNNSDAEQADEKQSSGIPPWNSHGVPRAKNNALCYHRQYGENPDF